MIYVNQLGYPHVHYNHNVANGGVPEERRNVATSGCGLCSACMIVNNLTTKRLEVEECARLAEECGANERVGSRMRVLGPVIAERYGLVYSTTNDPAELVAHLQNGGMAVANVAGDHDDYHGLFSSRSGHYVVIISTDGKELCVLDPSYQFGKFDTDSRRGKVRLDIPFIYCSLEDMEADVAPRDIHYYLFKRR